MWCFTQMSRAACVSLGGTTTSFPLSKNITMSGGSAGGDVCQLRPSCFNTWHSRSQQRFPREKGAPREGLDKKPDESGLHLFERQRPAMSHASGKQLTLKICLPRRGADLIGFYTSLVCFWINTQWISTKSSSFKWALFVVGFFYC